MVTPKMPTDLLSTHDAQAEIIVAACLLADPARCAPLVSQRLTALDFVDGNLGRFCEAVVALTESGRGLGHSKILISELRAMNLPGDVTSSEFLLKLNKAIVNVSGIVYYADRVREMARLRTIQAIAVDTYNDASSTREDAGELLARLDAQIATARSTAIAEARPIGEICKELVADWRAGLHRPQVRALLSGFPTLDELGFVFAPGELTVLAARTGVGKTSLAAQIAIHHAKHNRCVLMASLEMRDKEFVARILTAASGVNHQHIRIGSYTERDLTDADASSEEFRYDPLYVWSPGRVRASAISAAASVIKSRYDLKLLIVDYIGYVVPDDKRADRRDQIGEVVKALRGVGQRLEIPVLALCQLNRESDKERSRPRLSQLRESGCIEEDADSVAMLWPNAKDPREVEFILEKNRFGKVGTKPLRWIPEITRFAEPDVSHHGNYDAQIADWNNR